MIVSGAKEGSASFGRAAHRLSFNMLNKGWRTSKGIPSRSDEQPVHSGGTWWRVAGSASCFLHCICAWHDTALHTSRTNYTFNKLIHPSVVTIPADSLEKVVTWWLRSHKWPERVQGGNVTIWALLVFVLHCHPNIDMAFLIPHMLGEQPWLNVVQLSQWMCSIRNLLCQNGEACDSHAETRRVPAEIRKGLNVQWIVLSTAVLYCRPGGGVLWWYEGAAPPCRLFIHFSSPQIKEVQMKFIRK